MAGLMIESYGNVLVIAFKKRLSWLRWPPGKMVDVELSINPIFEYHALCGVGTLMLNVRCYLFSYGSESYMHLYDFND